MSHPQKPRKSVRALWTSEEEAYMRQHYADTKTQALADYLGRSLQKVYAKAECMGLNKSPAFLASEASGRMKQPLHGGTKPTIKLGGNKVTPEQAAAEWDAKKETHDRFVKWESIDSFLYLSNDINFVPHSNEKFEYELRPKPAKVVVWTGSREDVIALIKEMGLL